MTTRWQGVNTTRATSVGVRWPGSRLSPGWPVPPQLPRCPPPRPSQSPVLRTCFTWRLGDTLAPPLPALVLSLEPPLALTRAPLAASYARVALGSQADCFLWFLCPHVSASFSGRLEVRSPEFWFCFIRSSCLSLGVCFPIRKPEKGRDHTASGIPGCCGDCPPSAHPQGAQFQPQLCRSPL